MTIASASFPGSPRPLSNAPGWIVLAIGLTTLAPYWNSFSVPFLFDDIPAILDREAENSAAGLLPLRSDPGETLSGRPVLAFSIALNRWISGTHVWSFHAFNVVVHILAALTLFGIVRRTLEAPPLRARFGRSAHFLAAAIALLWSLHPLQTESVTYIIQRAESLMGLWFLLTLYGCIRFIESPRLLFWPLVSLTCCALGMATKEVMAAAPIVVLLYDRMFAAGSFAAAWRVRKLFHLSLAGTWLILAGLVLSTGGRGGTAGFDTAVSP